MSIGLDIKSIFSVPMRVYGQLFEDGLGPGLGPVGGGFQPPLECVYPGGGARIIFVSKSTEFLYLDHRFNVNEKFAVSSPS
jgi:hypothetical protein